MDFLSLFMYKKIVVKIGTKVITEKDGKLDHIVLERIVEGIVSLRKKGISVVLVTSGAMASGRSLLSFKGKEHVSEKQVLASIGQVKLMSTYLELFGKHKYLCAQILVTKEDFRDKTHYLNMRNCFGNLLLENVVPIVNENDVVATSELLFTDNDELAGLVASQLNAEAVIILTSASGVMAGDFKDKNSKVISEINFKDIHLYEKYITPEKTSFGRGGMLTKFDVARKMASEGIATYIADGRAENILLDIILGKKIGTKFIPQKRSSALKRRIAHSEGLTKGTVWVNQCAEDLLVSKSSIMSLLPIGVVKVEGDFAKGDTIEIKGIKKQKLGFGVAQYDSIHAKEFMGKKNKKPIIHYNYMFIDG